MKKIIFNKQKISIENNKFNLNEVFYALNYPLLKKNKFVSKKVLLNLLNINRKNDREFMFYLDSCNLDPVLDIFSFICSIDSDVAKNKDFNNLWKIINSKELILIEPDLLKIIGGENYTIDSFINFLKETNTPFEKVNYTDPRIINYEFIIQEINEVDIYELDTKQYIIMSIGHFKEVCMIKSEIIKNFYTLIENFYFPYIEYLKDYLKSLK